MNHFYEYGYYLLSDFFTQEEVNKMYDVYITKDDSYMSKMFIVAQDRLEGLLDTKLLPNYHTGEIYRDDKTIDDHVSGAPCEIALTFTIAHNGKNWPIILNTRKGLKSIITKPGDALIFKGCDIPYSREINTFNDMQIQYYMYWNDINSELGSFLRHFTKEERCKMQFNLNDINDGEMLPLWNN